MNRFIPIILIVICVFASYANSLRNPFIWDDIPLIVENPYIKSINNLPNVFSSDIFHAEYRKGNYYRPLQLLTYMFDYSFWRLNPFGFHLTNTLLHLLCALLVYWLVSSLSKDKILALISALLFSVHPAHTEAVTYISGRADSLAVVFILLSILSYLKSKTSKNEPLYNFLSLICFIFALLSKEYAIILPFALIFIDAYFLRPKKKISPYFSYFIILGIYMFLRTTVLNFAQKPVMIFHGDFLLRLIGSLKSIIIYIGIVLFPFNLHMERFLPIPASILEPSAILSVLLLSAIIFVAVKIRKSEKLISFGIGWFLLSLIPVLGVFMPKKELIIAEHWMYFASIGIFIAMAAILEKIIKFKKTLGICLLIGILFYYSFIAIIQNSLWNNPKNYYKQIIAFSPQSSKAHFNLAVIYEEEGDYNSALKEYAKAQELDPGYFLVHNNMGNVYFQTGEYEKAGAEYKKCLEIDPNYFLAYNNLGNVYAITKEYDNAIACYRQALALNPSYSESHNNLGRVYHIGKQDYSLAETEFKLAIKFNPDNAEAYNNLGNLYLERGLKDQAISCYKTALKINPDFERARANLDIATQ